MKNRILHHRSTLLQTTKNKPTPYTIVSDSASSPPTPAEPQVYSPSAPLTKSQRVTTGEPDQESPDQEQQESLLQTEQKQPQRVPRVPAANESLLPMSVQDDLLMMRSIGETMNIPNQQIWAHEDTISAGPENGKIWYNSFDVGKVVSKVIPRAMSDGYPREDEFTTPQLPIHAPPLEHQTINVQKMVNDFSSFSKDLTFLNNLVAGSPQSYCGRFETTIHENLPMTEAGRQKLRETIIEDIALKRCSILVPMTKLLEIIPVVLSSPSGSIPKNSGEKAKINKGTHTMEQIDTRNILNASKESRQTKQSLNMQTSYETLHSAEFIRLRDIEQAVLSAVARLKELGFDDHTDRVLIWKADIKSAYRLMMSAVADHWLGVHGIDDKFVVEYAQQFGQKSSVTIFHRFVYALSALMSEPRWAKEHFPTMSLDEDFTAPPATSRPPREKIEKELKRFREDKQGPGILDPDVFCWFGWYLDDFHGISIDVRKDISLPLEADDEGIRHPLGKALSFFLRKYGIPENLKKRVTENDPMLMGNQRPIALGIQLDINQLRVYVREDYKESLTEILRSWVTEGPKKRRHRDEWGLVQGRLGFATMVYPHFKAFMREIWSTYANILRQNQAYWSPKEVILENMKFMIDVLEDNPGRSMHHNRAWRTNFQRGLEFAYKTPETEDINHDACPAGWGFMNANTRTYYHRPWRKRELLFAAKNKIFILEAAAMFITFVINAPNLTKSKINMIGDNEGLVKSFHTCGSKTPIVNAIVREFIKILSSADIVLNCDRNKFDTQLCSTVEMKGADALSRNDIEAFHKHIQERHPGAKFTCIADDDDRLVHAETLWETILNKYTTH